MNKKIRLPNGGENALELKVYGVTGDGRMVEFTHSAGAAREGGNTSAKESRTAAQPLDLDSLTRYDHRGALMVPDKTGDYFLVPDVRALTQARATRLDTTASASEWADKMLAHPRIGAALLAEPVQAGEAVDAQASFESWANGHGGLPLDRAGDNLKTDDGLLHFPTYKFGRTEIAWRAFANSRATLAPVSAQAEQAAAVRSAYESATDQAMQRACRDLPEFYQVHVELENGCGCVVWYDQFGASHDIEGEGFLSDDINEAIDCAIKDAFAKEAAIQAPSTGEADKEQK